MKNARDLYREGFELFVQAKLEEAVSKYREAVALDDGLALAWNALSIALGRLGELDDAIAAGERLLELEPDDPLSHTNLSRLLQQKGMIPEAEEQMALAARLEMKRSK